MLKTFKHSKIIASHDLDLILDVCERCLVIGGGAVVADGPSSEILSNRRSFVVPRALVIPEGSGTANPSKRLA